MARTKLKRDVDTIDLTGDSDDQDISRQAPKATRLSHGSTASTPAEGNDDAEEDIDDIIPSQEHLNQAFASYELYGSSNQDVLMNHLTQFTGTLKSKIVGVRYYNGYATVGEMVLLKREPHNQVSNV